MRSPAQKMIDAIKDMHRMVEVHNGLILSIGKTLLPIMDRLGMVKEIEMLGHQFQIAAQIMEAGKQEMDARKEEEE